MTQDKNRYSGKGHEGNSQKYSGKHNHRHSGGKQESNETSRSETLRARFKKSIELIGDLLEYTIGIIVLIAIVISIISLFPTIVEYWEIKDQAGTFAAFLERVLATVIGIEFLKMLVRPNAENVLEILIFLVARHTIIVNDSAMDNFISVMSICIMVILRRFLGDTRHKHFWDQLLETMTGRTKNNKSRKYKRNRQEKLSPMEDDPEDHR